MINFYSNPDVKFKGVPTGRTEKKGVANAAKVLREKRFVIAGIGYDSQECGSLSFSTKNADSYDYGTVGRSLIVVEKVLQNF